MKSRFAGESVSHTFQDMNLNRRFTLTSCTFKPEPKLEYRGTGCLEESGRLYNGSSGQSGLENLMSRCSRIKKDHDRVTVTSEDNSRSSLVSTVDDKDDLTAEIQQAYRIFQSFLSEQHKATAAPFWHPVGSGSHVDQASDSEMCFKQMDDKFVNGEYESITAFVTDFRLMLENCYRFHGVDHWISRQAQKLEVILEQKLTLLSRTLREKTTLAMTSGGRFGTEDEKCPKGTSSRRRSVPRCLAAITVGGNESIMVQALRLEELQRAKEEKRQRELERKEAEDVSVKEVEKWERSLLLLAEPSPVCTMWELPAIGHFLCLAQKALNLPEIIYYELEQCLLMPRCSSFLAKVMTSLLCPPPKRATLHRCPSLPYRKWEAELRLKVQGWYRAVGRAKDQVACAEQLGLCHQFFWTVGEMNPLEETAFHLLPFNHRVWLLKGLCDHVYETQKDVQDAVLAQPIHECRESILGYDSQENTYIHFPHFCGADLRIYRQSPCLSMEFPLPLFPVKRSEEEMSLEGSEVKEETNVKGQFPSVDGVKVESDATEVCAWGAKLCQKCPSSVPLQCKEDSGSLKSTVVERLKEEIGEGDGQPCFRVGDSCYKGKSPALNLHKKMMTLPTLEKKRPCGECSRESQETARLCSHCQLLNDHIRPGVNQRRQQDDSAEGAARTTTANRKKRKQKKEKRNSVKNTDRLRLKSRRAKKSLHRAAAKKKQKLRKKFDIKMMSQRRTVENRSSHLPVEPTFQLVCSSLDDLRALISRTEDELDELNNIKKRSGRWQHKRSTVKELHITLIRLLNELLPWEPKLVKAFQKNRARLKKECDDFKKHPEYENFSREQMETAYAGERFGGDASLSTETARELEDEDKIGRTLRDTEAPENINQLGNHKSKCLDHRSEIIMACNERGPITRGSKRCHRGASNEEVSLFKRGKMDPDSSMSVIPHLDQTSTSPQNLERALGLSEPVRNFQGTYKPIQALLAKSVGNKVTLINHPKAAIVTQRLQHKTASANVRPSSTCSPTPRSEPTSIVSLTPAAVSATGSPDPVVYKTAGGLGFLRKGGTSMRFSVKPISDQTSGEKVIQQVILPSSLLVQSTEKKAAQQSPTVISVSVSNTTTDLSNASGFTAPENRVPVQQVAPLKDTSDIRTPSAAVLPSLQILPTTTGGSAVPKKTTEPKAASNKSTSQTSCSSIKPDAKQELRTVCIRDSQSILVTTRGGNTGVVKVQTSEQSGTGNLKPSPVYALSSQLQAFLVSKSSTSTTQAVSGTLSTGSLPTISQQSSINRGSSQSLLKDIISVSSSAVVTRTLNQTCNDSSVSADGSSDKMLIAGKSQLLATSKTGDDILVTAKDVHSDQQRTVFKQPQQSSGPKSRALDQSSFQKVFLVPPSTNIPLTATEVAISTASASRILGTNSNMSPVIKFFTKNTPVIVSRVLATSTSSGIQSRETRNSEGLLKATESVDDKTLTFSTPSTGHMASSALLSVVKKDSAGSVLNFVNSKPGLVVGSSTADMSCFLSGSVISKHTKLPVNVMAKNQQMISSYCTLPLSVNTTSCSSTAGLSHLPVMSSAVNTGSSSTSLPVIMNSGMRPNSDTKSVQEKIVINTTTPLAPGTQLLINNTRLVVPAQGLGTGSHVLLISSSCPGDLQKANARLASIPPRCMNDLGPCSVPSMNLVSAQQTLVRLPSPTTAKVGSSNRVRQQMNVRSPPTASGSAVSWVTQSPHVGVSSEQPGLVNIVKLPIFETFDGKGLISTQSHGPTGTPGVCCFSQGGLLSTTSAMLLQARLDRSPPQNQVSSFIQPVKTVISQNSPIVTRPPVSSTISRMLNLPVTTVPPIGCPTNSSQATCIATVPPSVKTVIMTPCQPIRPVEPRTTEKHLVLPQPAQVQSKSAVQMTSGVNTSTASKLLLSPDGAILNIVPTSAPSSIQVQAKPETVQVDVPITRRVTVPVSNTNEPVRQSDVQGGLNH